MYSRVKLSMAALALAAAWTLVPLPSFGAGITNTDHDFTSAGASTTCVTCHTPHKSASTDLGLAWNHTLSANALTFGTNASTAAGTSLPTNVGSWAGSTKFCLSCHDGSVAVGDMIKGTDWSTTNRLTGAVVGTGGNIQGNHPVAIPYPDQANASYNGISSKANPSLYVANPAGVKLYGSVTGQKGVECGSCHDPHSNANGSFLRVANNAVCTSCHNK